MAVVDTEVRRALHSEIQSPTAKLVYLSLAYSGRASVGELHDRIGEPRIRVYGVLDALVDRGLVHEERSDGGPVYAVDR